MIKRINGIQGFIGTTYAIYNGRELVKIVCNKKEAEEIEKNIKLENEIIEKTFDQYKEQLKYYSVEKLKLSNVFSDYMLQTINKLAFDLGYEITIDKENELLEKVYIELVKEEKKAC